MSRYIKVILNEQERLQKFGKKLGLTLYGFDHLGQQQHASFLNAEPPHQYVSLPYWLIERISNDRLES